MLYPKHKQIPVTLLAESKMVSSSIAMLALEEHKMFYSEAQCYRKVRKCNSWGDKF